jgi:hypothetical protein
LKKAVKSKKIWAGCQLDLRIKKTEGAIGEQMKAASRQSKVPL